LREGLAILKRGNVDATSFKRLRCKIVAGDLPDEVSLRQLKAKEASMGFDVVLRMKSWGCNTVPTGNARDGSGLERASMGARRVH